MTENWEWRPAINGIRSPWQNFYPYKGAVAGFNTIINCRRATALRSLHPVPTTTALYRTMRDTGRTKEMQRPIIASRRQWGLLMIISCDPLIVEPRIEEPFPRCTERMEEVLLSEMDQRRESKIIIGYCCWKCINGPNDCSCRAPRNHRGTRKGRMLRWQTRKIHNEWEVSDQAAVKSHHICTLVIHPKGVVPHFLQLLLYSVWFGSVHFPNWWMMAHLIINFR